MRLLREMEQAGVKLDTERLREISDAGQGRGRRARARDLRARAARSSRSARPSSSRRSCSASSACRASAAARPATRPTRACCRRSAHEHEIIPKIERWRELTKLAQTYLDALPLLIDADGRLHTTFNQTAATTGRLSSNNPNLQNIPIRTALGREIRACFVAEPGDVLVSADYSQVELRLLAHIAGEDVLKEIFRRGEDVHTATACRVFGVTPDQIDPGMRSKAKMINYGIVYGLSAYGMADRLDIPQEEADEFIQRYLAGFPAVAPVHRGDDRAGHRARLRLDAVRPPAPGAGAARAPLGAAQAGRAVRGQHGHPGHRRRHHEGRDGPLRPGARGGRAALRGWSSRSTTSCCSRARPTRPSRSGRSPSARWRAPSSWIRRWRSRRASARTGWRRSEATRRASGCASRDRPGGASRRMAQAKRSAEWCRDVPTWRARPRQRGSAARHLARARAAVRAARCSTPTGPTRSSGSPPAPGLTFDARLRVA